MTTPEVNEIEWELELKPPLDVIVLLVLSALTYPLVVAASNPIAIVAHGVAVVLAATALLRSALRIAWHPDGMRITLLTGYQIVNRAGFRILAYLPTGDRMGATFARTVYPLVGTFFLSARLKSGGTMILLVRAYRLFELHQPSSPFLWWRTQDISTRASSRDIRVLAGG